MEQRRSGYVGVHWHQGAGKWTTSIRINGVHRYLGLFDSAETAHAAYLQAKALKDSAKPQLNAEGMRHAIIAEIRSFYEEHGIVALSVPFLARIIREVERREKPVVLQTCCHDSV